MSFSWAYGKIDREELQKVGCSNDLIDGRKSGH